MSGGVQISPNLRKQSIKIDTFGNEVDSKTGEFLGNINDTYKPTKKELEGVQSKPVLTAEELSESIKEIKSGVIEYPKTVQPVNNMESKIEAMISSKIEALVEKKVNEVLEKLLK